MADDISTQDKADEAGRSQWIAEEQWHIENATTDLSLFMRPIEPGSMIGSAEVFSPSGKRVALELLWSERPALVITGSLTCPPSRRFIPAANKLQQEFGHLLNVCILYVVDAHPSGDMCPYTGTDWLTIDNEAEGILIRQPETQQQRTELAQRFIKEFDINVAVYTDNMENVAWDKLGRWPNTALLIGAGSKVLLWQDWYRPDDLRAQLHQYFE